LKPGEQSLAFQFLNLDSQLHRFPSARYAGKVVVLQLMGSWCPNCMDETEFLSRFYNEQAAEKTVEVIALAYEVSTDFQRSAASIKRFQQRFDVQYPMLVTGVRVGDPEKAAKTLPSLTDIRYFPTTIFIGKDGRIRRIHAGFYGPGAAQEHADYKKDFYNTIRTLMAE
jgi:thiol-disulfide isomerase/thioredoxin